VLAGKQGLHPVSCTEEVAQTSLVGKPPKWPFVTDRAPVYPRVLDELVPAARHVTEQYANNAIEADHGRLKARLRPMRGLKRLAPARTITAGQAFVQNLRRAATTRSPPTCPCRIGSASPSTSWPWSSDDRGTNGGPGASTIRLAQRNSAVGACSAANVGLRGVSARTLSVAAELPAAAGVAR
jgi:hypothetical protein